MRTTELRTLLLEKDIEFQEEEGFFKIDYRNILISETKEKDIQIIIYSTKHKESYFDVLKWAMDYAATPLLLRGEPLYFVSYPKMDEITESCYLLYDCEDDRYFFGQPYSSWHQFAFTLDEIKNFPFDTKYLWTKQLTQEDYDELGISAR